MNAPPQDPPDQTHRPTTRLVAYVAEDGGSTVDLEKESEEWRVLQVTRTLGAGATATLARDLGAIGKRVENRELTPYQRTVEIWSLDEDGERVYPLFRGVMLINRAAIASGSEVETAEAVIPNAWFGDQCEGQRVWDPDADDTTVVHIDLEFNPLVDGRVISNEALRDVVPGSTTEIWPLWIDPESARTEEAAQSSGLAALSSLTKWTVSHAVEALQQFLNEDATFIENFPAIDGTVDPPIPDAAFGDSPELEDEVLPRGHYLPAYLDSLLPKYGFNWTLDFKDDPDNPTQLKPFIRCYKRGNGLTKLLPYQAIGETLNVAGTQPLSVDLTTDLSKLANVFVAHGSLQEREVTIELVRGWPEDDDGTAVSDLDKSQEDYAIANDRTWRKWVGNEAGDYNDTRSDITETLDLSTVFPDGYVPKRRPCGDCLTYRAAMEQEGVRHPPILEYSVNAGVPGSWQRAGQDWRPLTHEFGVYLTDIAASGLVKTLRLAGDNARLRLTGTIRGDERVRAEVDRGSTSPLELETRMFLDLSHRFHDRQRVSSGPHASQLSGTHDEADHEEDLEDFLEKVSNVEKAAVVQLDVPLHGLVFDFEIGDVIENIDGRNLSLNRLLPSASETQGVQVVGLTWNAQTQQTQLLVAPFDAYVAMPRLGRV